MPIVTLTTDFGLEDHYVAVMKAVIISAAPKVELVDVTHRVPKFNVAHGAMILRQIVEWFPPGTAHLVVVDPGVGGDRAVLAFRYNGQFVICPDNGLITLVHRTWPFETARRIEQSAPARSPGSATFQGRDVMAPAAAFLAKGGAIDQLGAPVDAVELLDLTASVLLPDGTIRGEVVYVDSFGNLVTNISRGDVSGAFAQRRVAQVFLNDTQVGPIRRTYSEVEPGTGVALFGSSDLLEVAVNRGVAAKVYGVQAGARVVVR